jgi:hypothetical protein
VEAGSGIADLSRWPQLPSVATFRGQDTATGQRAAPGDWARDVAAVADAMAGAGHSANPRFSAESYRDRATAPCRTPSAERNLVSGTTELEFILTEIADDVAAACS